MLNKTIFLVSRNLYSQIFPSIMVQYISPIRARLKFKYLLSFTYFINAAHASKRNIINKIFNYSSQKKTGKNKSIKMQLKKEDNKILNIIVDLVPIPSLSVKSSDMKQLEKHSRKSLRTIFCNLQVQTNLSPSKEKKKYS